MKKFPISVPAVLTLTAGAAPAMAAPWQSINQRQANLERAGSMWGSAMVR